MLITDLEGDHLRQALVDLLDDKGVLDSPSLRTIARAAGVTPTTLTNWFGSKSALHARVLDVVGARVRGILMSQGFPRPAAPDAASWKTTRATQEFADLRLRLALGELARADDALAETLARVVRRERSAIRSLVGGSDGVADLDEVTLDLLHAVMVGLWSRMCDRAAPLDAARAPVMWAEACARIAPGQLSTAGGGCGADGQLSSSEEGARSEWTSVQR